MLITCIANTIKQVSADDPLAAELRDSYHLPGGEFRLTLGRSYIVYAIDIRRGYPWYFISDDDHSALGYPVAYPSSLFSVADGRLSRHWVCRLTERMSKDSSLEIHIFLTFSKWADDATFYERLLDGDPRAVAIFERHKASMDVEFPHPSIAASAEACEEDWFICPDCGDAWQSRSRDAILRCPKCSALLRNPSFESEEDSDG